LAVLASYAHQRSKPLALPHRQYEWTKLYRLGPGAKEKRYLNGIQLIIA
jgi:hypothetical protein